MSKLQGASGTNAGYFDPTVGQVIGAAMAAASGTDHSFQITPTYSQSGTGGSTDILVNRTETSLGSGVHLFIDCQVAGVSSFSVDHIGACKAHQLTVNFGGGGVINLGSNNSQINDSSGTLSINGGSGTTQFGFGTILNMFDASGTRIYRLNPASVVASSGTTAIVALTPTYNQTGTAGSIDHLINRVETALGSGTHYFANYQVAGVSKYSVDHLGTALLAGSIGVNGSAAPPKPTVTGSKGANAALASLLTALASYGLITDSST
jgi:hypothetical protein